MGLVVATAVVALAGCYEPSLRDCVVSCAAINDCAAGQTCSAGVCAGAGVSCAARDAPSDALGDAPGDSPAPADGAPVSDARPADAPPADAAVDAPSSDLLHVMIAGKGQVVVDGIGTCTGGLPGTTGDCTFTTPASGTLTAHAQVVVEEQAFDKWTDPSCKTQPATCVFAPAPLAAITAHFKGPAPARGASR